MSHIHDVAIVGIGIEPFGPKKGVSGREQGARATRRALHDAGIEWRDIEFSAGGSFAAGSADAMVNELGLTGVPFVNVSNMCATGASTVVAAADAIACGRADLALAVGFDKHPRGAFNLDPEDLGLEAWYGESGLMLTTQFFAMKLQRYMFEYNIGVNTLATIGAKAYSNGALNPNAWRRTPLDESAIINSMMLNCPLTKYMFCSPSEGGVALVLCRADKARQYNKTPIYIRAAEIRTRQYGTFEVFSPSVPLDGSLGPTSEASKAAFEAAGLGPEDIDIAQLQDTEVGAELMHMAENGFCSDGEQVALLAAGETQIDGRFPINTDGGCIANGEPIGASGLRQVYENCLQLRGQAGAHQVPKSIKTAYSHVYGAPGVSAVMIVQR